MTTIKNRGINHPVDDPEFVRGWHRGLEGDDSLALCRHCGNELNSGSGEWLGYDGRYCDEAQTVPHEPLPRPV